MSRSAADGTLPHRRLRLALRGHRARAGFTQLEVATALEWSLTKVQRIENGDVRVSMPDLLALLSVYAVTDPDEIEQLRAWARAAQHQSWRSYRDVHSASFLRFLAYEANAARICYTATVVVPAPLQIEPYSRAMLGSSQIVAPSPAHIERLLDVGRQRRKILQGTHPPAIVAFLDESVIRRTVGGPAVMRDQLRHLVRVVESGRVSIRILPFSARTRPLARRDFILLTFADPQDPPVLQVEHTGGSVTFDEPSSFDSRKVADLRSYQEAIGCLADVALPEPASLALIQAAILDSDTG